MNAHPPVVRLLTFLLAIGALAARGDELVKPHEAQLRASVTKSLAFLDKETDAWMNERDCNACHHMPGLIWSHREAQRRGFAIDQAKFDEFLDWSVSRAKKGKSADEVIALMKLAMGEQAPPEFTKLVVDSQLPDGSWKLGGQFATMQRREAPEATGNSLRLFLLALGSQPAEQSLADGARTKAAAALAKRDPPKSLETLIFRALYARRFGPPDEVTNAREEVLKLQHPDGGWGWMIGEEQSDSLATGQALYLLQQSPEVSSVEAIARAQGWLVSHQREDGGWSIDITRISRLDRSGPAKAKSFKDATGIYTFWGSAWATIGLEQGFPIKEPQSAAAQ
ncbi:MAG: prenyltransferase/squalene oxidase repeat-containing protein [Chthoniobacter sp.]|uniref:prenyltransferase/squalene oxidase repeat-containing protein n=1 Tax=Chthoniobacter sp. TaxID=2510640 RepID=UPI0032A1D285